MLEPFPAEFPGTLAERQAERGAAGTETNACMTTILAPTITFLKQCRNYFDFNWWVQSTAIQTTSHGNHESINFR